MHLLRFVLLAFFTLVVSSGQARAQPSSQLTGVDGESVFSRAFLDDLRAAENAAREAKSVEPIAQLRAKYTRPEEIAELELMLGLHFSQRTGMI